MKKTISITISGIIFHIEEDGYEKLKTYLADIQRYFATYEDGAEISSDIENRIAEIFAGKVGAGKQVITYEDVDTLIATMGGIPDFEAIADEEPPVGASRPGQNSIFEKAQTSTLGTAKRLYRDLSRKVLGGVCSGIAAYFEMDPVWIRLLFLGTLLDLFFLPGRFSGFALLSYIILWIVVPGSGTVAENRDYKKLYRDPETKTLGGVCAGLSAYFGVDVAVVRLLFVVALLFFGSGLLLYIILWVSMPEANTLTEKMAMQGEPVTLSNIEANVKKNIQGDGNATENTLTKIVLFPFRAIAVVIAALTKALGPLAVFLVEAVRIFAGVIIMVVAVSFLIGFVTLLAARLGLGSFQATDRYIHVFPNQFWFVDAPVWTWLAGGLAFGIPVLFFAILGVGLLAKRNVVKPTVAWTLFSLWIVGIIGSVLSIPVVASQYQKESSYEKTVGFSAGDRGLRLALNDIDEDRQQRPRLELEGYNGSDLKLVQTFTARGSTREEAQKNAQMIDYQATLSDTTLAFDSNFEYKENARFRNQSLSMKLYIPYGKQFSVDADVRDILENTLERNGYDDYSLDDNLFAFNQQEGLVCVTCTEEKNYDDKDFYNNGKRYDYRDFQELTVSGPFKVVVEQDDRYRVAVEGNPDDVENVEFDLDGNELKIRWRKDFLDWDWDNNSRITLRITMPKAEKLAFSGATAFEVNDFDDLDALDISVSAAARGEIEANANRLTANVDAAGQLTLRGNAKDLEANVTSAAKLSAYDLETETAEVTANSGASVEVNAKDRLEADANSGGSIRYRGGARLQGKSNSGGSIDRD